MASLVECVPNVSEGSDTATLDAISDAITGRAGVWQLDRSADVDHARAVFTLAGFPGPLMDAMEAVVEAAVEHIDMRRQHGQHPRIGAVDVIPFVPLGDSTLDRCVAGAREFAARIADRFELPVYLYAAAAPQPGVRTLADIRRPGFEGLAAAMRTAALAPDLGPGRPHPTAGAVAVGARPFLIAWNLQLSTTDVAVARRIAHRIRERDGGLPGVQALGLDLASQGCAQLSMNVLDHTRTPMWRVWREAGRLAAAEGVSILDSELVGLVPDAALLEVADHLGVAASHPPRQRMTEAADWLRIRRFDPSMAVGIRLGQVRARS